MIRHDSDLCECNSFQLDLIPGSAHTTVIISDSGSEFDPLASQPATPHDIGGHGISIIQGLASDVQYQRKDDQNVLTVVLPSTQA